MRNNSEPEEDQTLKAVDLMRMLKISPNTFKKLLADGSLPRPLPLGTRSRRWSRSVVMDFLNNQDNYKTKNNTQI